MIQEIINKLVPPSDFAPYRAKIRFLGDPVSDREMMDVEQL